MANYEKLNQRAETAVTREGRGGRDKTRELRICERRNLRKKTRSEREARDNRGKTRNKLASLFDWTLRSEI